MLSAHPVQCLPKNIFRPSPSPTHRADGTVSTISPLVHEYVAAQRRRGNCSPKDRIGELRRELKYLELNSSPR